MLVVSQSGQGDKKPFLQLVELIQKRLFLLP